MGQPAELARPLGAAVAPYNGTDVYDLIVAVVVGLGGSKASADCVAAKATQEAGLPDAEPG